MGSAPITTAEIPVTVAASNFDVECKNVGKSVRMSLALAAATCTTDHTFSPEWVESRVPTEEERHGRKPRTAPAL